MDELAPTRTLTDGLEPYLAVDRTPRRGPCWVMGHMVAGLDGTAAIAGKVGALSTASDQVLFRRMRQVADVVMVGAETVRREGYGVVALDDDARRRRREQGLPPTPPLAVVSRSLNLDWTAAAFRKAPAHARTLVVTCGSADARRREAAAQVADLVVAGDEKVDVRQAFRALAQRGHRVVVCEGGPTWLGFVVAAGLLDELCLSVSPVMGGDRLPVAVTPDGAGLTHFELRHVLAEHGTLFLRYEAAP